MKRFLVCFLTLPVLFVSFVQLSAFSNLKKHEVKNESVGQKRSTNFKINEEDFINTMFLRSSFFENWSDTNYFVNPTLKTSKSLIYNENWYLDFLKDSYATGIVFDKPSEQFLELYKNWDNYVKQYKLNRFYNVDKKFFLKDLTNFMYTYFKKYDGTGKATKMEQSIKNLEKVKFNEENWKLVTDMSKEKGVIINKNVFEDVIVQNGKHYFVIFRLKGNEIPWKIYKLEIGKPNSMPIYSDDLKDIKAFYRWDGASEPTTPTINKDTGKITDWQFSNEINFFWNIVDEVIKENIRVQQGGSSNYEKLDADGTQKIIFDFEIIDEVDKQKKKKIVYRMVLTINREQVIRAGTISLIHYVNDKYDDEQLNFMFDFAQDSLQQDSWHFNMRNFKFVTLAGKVEQNVIIYDRLDGLIDINAFLKQFFSNVLMPVFNNRGAFMEASYLDFLTYDTVVVNFLGLKVDNFLSVVKLHHTTNNKVEQNEKDEIYFKLKWKNILNSSFKIMNNFYKNYLRVMFDLENETYIQGYNKKFGLLVSNGFKIFPKYFYFSDKYKNLDVKIYSSHANKFYQTKYGKVFNFDYSVYNNFKVDNTHSYLFDDKKQYPLRVKDLSIQKVGYGVFELQAQKENEFYHYYDFNFGIYNWKDLTSLVDKPTGQWWGEQIENCKWYDMVCHLKNGAIWIVNNIPGVKQANELASGVGKLFQTTYNFFVQTFEIWKINLDFYIVITNTFLLIIFMKFIRMF